MPEAGLKFTPSTLIHAYGSEHSPSESGESPGNFGVLYGTSQTPESVLAFYRQELTSRGWAVGRPTHLVLQFDTRQTLEVYRGRVLCIVTVLGPFGREQLTPRQGFPAFDKYPTAFTVDLVWNPDGKMYKATPGTTPAPSGSP